MLENKVFGKVQAKQTQYPKLKNSVCLQPGGKKKKKKEGREVQNEIRKTNGDTITKSSSKLSTIINIMESPWRAVRQYHPDLHFF